MAKASRKPTNSGEERHWADLFATIAALRTPQETRAFLRDLCTRAELDAMAHRWQVAQKARASTATVTRVAQWLRNGEGGYRLALARRAKRRRG